MWKFTISAALGVCLTACSGAPVAAPPSTRTDAHGERLFQELCASCHGIDARGNGPVAEFLTVRPADLTRIAARRAGVFPHDDIWKIVDGQAELAAHGTRQMPIWGYELFGHDADDEDAHGEATGKIDHLVNYLSSIQRAE